SVRRGAGLERSCAGCPLPRRAAARRRARCYRDGMAAARAFARDRVRRLVAPEQPDVEVIDATYVRHAFAPHVHDTFSIGVLTRRAQRFRCGGATHVAAAGELCIVNPGEVHTGAPASAGGWRYFALFPSPALVERIARDALGARGALHVAAHVVSDRAVANAVLAAARSFARPATALARDIALAEALALLLAPHGGPPPPPRPRAPEPPPPPPAP